jgi:hypothetical protein
MFTNECEMSEGDLCDYVRAQGKLAAMSIEAMRHPWRSKALRALAHVEANKLRDIASRYSEEVQSWEV